MNMNRRQFVTGLTAATLSAPLLSAAEEKTKRFQVTACDWSIGKKMNLDGIGVAKEIGLDGLEVSFGRPGGRYDLRKPEVRKQYLAASKQHGIEISSLAMAVLNGVPYAKSKEAEQWVVDVVDVLPEVGVTTCLMAFFGGGNIKGNRALQDEVIKRLKKVAPKAEKNGVVLGVESWMNAEEHIRIVDEVASPAVKVYFDVANMQKQGYDVPREIRTLGRKRLCHCCHCKENGYLLGKGKVDFLKVKEAMDDIGYGGWLVIEGAVPKGMSMMEAYKQNQAFLRKTFDA